MSTAKWFLGGGVIFLCALSIPLFMLAAEKRAGEQVGLSATEVVADDLYMAGGTVTSAGRIAGDLYSAGGTILASGPIGEDAVLAGGNVSVLGSVGDDVRIGAGNIVLQGAVGGDAILAGGQIILGGAGVRGEAIIAGGLIRVDAPITRDLKITGGEVLINAPVRGNVEVDAEKLTLGSAAVISGNLTYTSPKEAEMQTGATVRGKVEYTPRESRDATNIGKAVAVGIISAVALFKLLMLLVGSMFFGLFFRRYANELVAGVRARPWIELGRGFATVILLPVVSMILLATVVGIPLGALGLIAAVALMISGGLMAPVLLGNLLHRWIKKSAADVSWKNILLGVVVFWLIGIVPFIGGLAQCALVLLAIGSMVRIKWSTIKEWR